MSRRKAVCPKCQSKEVVKIIYGYPTHKLFEEARAEKVKLGGCVISSDSPNYACKSCRHEW
jgi:hypothetical protein